MTTGAGSVAECGTGRLDTITVVEKCDGGDTAGADCEVGARHRSGGGGHAGGAVPRVPVAGMALA